MSAEPAAARLQGLGSGDRRDLSQRNPGQRHEHVGTLSGETIDVAAAATPSAPMQRLGSHDPPFAMQPLQANLAGATRSGLESQGPDLGGRQQTMGVEETQHLELPGPYAEPHHEVRNRLGR